MKSRGLAGCLIGWIKMGTENERDELWARPV
jgi:hypothetical protein